MMIKKIFAKKYIVVFVIKEQGSFNIIGKRKIKSGTDKVKYGKDDSIPIDISTPTYSRGLKLIYFINVSSKLQILFENNKNEKAYSKAMDMIFNKQIIKQLTANLQDTSAFKANIMNMIIGALIGGLIAFILASYLTKSGLGI